MGGFRVAKTVDVNDDQNQVVCVLLKRVDVNDDQK